MDSPIVTGGTGGSGTRLIALLLQYAGVFMGSEVNYAMDSVPMNLLDMHHLHPEFGDWRSEFDGLMKRHLKGHDGVSRWGWKHTQSHLTLPMLHKLFPDLYYVHIVRDGRDIVYAPHAPFTYFGVGSTMASTPEAAIALWEVLNVLCASYGENFIERYYRVRYEDLCGGRRAETISAMYDFLGLSAELGGACRLVRPGNIGRWRGKREADTVTHIGEYGLKRFGYL